MLTSFGSTTMTFRTSSSPRHAFRRSDSATACSSCAPAATVVFLSAITTSCTAPDVASTRRTSGCTLLDVDPGRSTHRTVFTFVGEPAAVVEGALAGARVARQRIDMRVHKGEHARMGALDVCPFVPVAGVTMDECVA